MIYSILSSICFFKFLVAADHFDKKSISIPSFIDIDNDIEIKNDNNDFNLAQCSKLKIKSDPSYLDEEIHMAIVEKLDPKQIHNYPPKDVANLIGRYMRDFSLEELYEKVMDALGISIDKRRNLNVYGNYFLIHLNNLLSASKLHFYPMHIFWNDLSRLLFKLIIRIKQKSYMEIDRINLEAIIQNVKSIINMIEDKSGKTFPFNENFEFDRKKEGNLELFLNAEFLDNHYQLFPLFTFAIERFYKMEIEKAFDVSCTDLENTHFNQGNENIILKYLIVMYDPKESMRACLIKNDFKLDQFKHCPSNEEITQSYLDNLRVKGPKNLELLNMGYVNKSIIEFFLFNDKQFQISGPLYLSILLKELKRSKLLSKQTIIKICGFKIDDDQRRSSFKLDHLKFKEYLNISISREYITHSEYFEYMKLFK